MNVDYLAMADEVESLRERQKIRLRPGGARDPDVVAALAEAEARVRHLRETLFALLDPYRGVRVDYLERQLRWARGVYAALRDLRSVGRARFDRDRGVWYGIRVRALDPELPLRIKVLVLLEDGACCRAGDIATRLNESAATVGAVLRHLRAAGCVTANDERRDMQWTLRALGREWIDDPSKRASYDREPPMEPIEVEALAARVAADILHNGPAPVQALAKRLGRTPKHVTQACLLARRQGLLERRDDQTWAAPAGELFPMPQKRTKRAAEAASVRRMA